MRVTGMVEGLPPTIKQASVDPEAPLEGVWSGEKGERKEEGMETDLFQVRQKSRWAGEK
jgi:hypothetical protein